MTTHYWTEGLQRRTKSVKMFGPSMRVWAAITEMACNMSQTLARLLLTVREPQDAHESVSTISTEDERNKAGFPVEPTTALCPNAD